jgi:hypothetical protein
MTVQMDFPTPPTGTGKNGDGGVRRSPEVTLEMVRDEVQELNHNFRDRVLDKVERFRLVDGGKSALLLKKNPFLLAASASRSGWTIDMLLYSAITASMETMFGGLLHDVAEVVCNRNSRLTAVSAPDGSGKDVYLRCNLDGEEGDVFLRVSMKSGGYWANSSSTEGQAHKFKRQKSGGKRNSNTRDRQIVEGQRVDWSVVTLAYGRNRIQEVKNKKWDIQIESQAFWTWISGGNRTFSHGLIALLSEGSKEFSRRLEFALKAAHDRLAGEMQRFWTGDGPIDWGRIWKANYETENTDLLISEEKLRYIKALMPWLP